MTVLSVLITLMLVGYSKPVKSDYIELQDEITVQFNLYKGLMIGADSSNKYQLGYGYQDKNLIVVLGIQGRKEDIEILTEQFVEFTWKHRLHGLRASFILCQKSELNLSYRIVENLDLNLKLNQTYEMQ